MRYGQRVVAQFEGHVPGKLTWCLTKENSTGVDHGYAYIKLGLGSKANHVATVD